MPLNPGNQTVTFNPPGNFVVDKYHTVPASTGLTSFTQTGVNVQTATVKDAVANTAYAEATHKVYTLYNTNTAGAGAEWHIVLGTVSYRVIGVELVPDQWGRILFCQFICKEEQGGST